jgi:hypothetical protein
MATLRHEIWRDSDGLPMCCLAGPDGESARGLLGEGATLVSVFEAGSHFEAMTKYNQFLGREPFTTEQAWDRTPYPDEWRLRQGGS